MRKVFISLSIISILVADDISDIEKVINNHWDDWNTSKYKGYVSSMHSSGTMNGDSNGSFWYKMTPTVKNLTEDRKPGDKSNFTARYIEVDVLVPGKAAVAYYYLVGFSLFVIFPVFDLTETLFFLNYYFDYLKYYQIYPLFE